MPRDLETLQGGLCYYQHGLLVPDRVDSLTTQDTPSAMVSERCIEIDPLAPLEETRNYESRTSARLRPSHWW